MWCDVPEVAVRVCDDLRQVKGQRVVNPQLRVLVGGQKTAARRRTEVNWGTQGSGYKYRFYC